MSFSVEGFYPVVKTIEAANTQKDSLDLKELLLQYVGVNNLYSLPLVNNDLNFKSKLIVENLKKITDKSLTFEINCCLNNILIGEKIKRLLMKSGFVEQNINLNSYYETLENEIVISISSNSETKTVAVTKQTETTNISVTGNYTIQIGAFSSNVNTDKFKKLSNIKIYYGKDKYTRITVGEYETEEDAKTEIAKIKLLGFKEAFVRPITYYTNL